MGLLSLGTPLQWQESLPHHDYIKHHGVIQFINIYNTMKNRSNDIFLWGDEVEHMILQYDHTNSNVYLSLRAPQILEELESAIKQHNELDDKVSWNASFVPEYGSFMIEAIPANPYGGYTADLRIVEANMKLRREMIAVILKPNELLITLTAFPLMGALNYLSNKDYLPHGPVADSNYISDQIIGPHPRFATLTKNIRTRRGGKVDVRIPLFQDQNTKLTIQKQIEERKNNNNDKNTNNTNNNLDEFPVDYDEFREIHMDAMAFGMGCCCLQVTFQTRSIEEARHLYDHLACLAPIMLAATAATPFYRGQISDFDCRWTVISQAVDDRNAIERGEEALTESNAFKNNPHSNRKTQVLNKSRYDSISTFISLAKDFDTKYNDIPCEIDEQSYKTLIEAGIDELLAKHIAHLFVRDPLVIYDERISQVNDSESTEHFENIQSTNWQTVRFKPPPINNQIGWRVEFRTMEAQLTDFENAAFTVFIALISRAILFFDLNFYLPLSKVDENLSKAHLKDAILKQKFAW
jgi:glutamate--cysteine ligase catalytic subunit